MKEKLQKFVDELYLYRQDIKGLKSWALILLLMLMVFETALMARTEAEANNVCPISDAEVFKHLDLCTLDGKRFTSDDISDYDIILVDMWGTNCPHCIMEMPAAAKFSDNLEQIFPHNRVLYIGIVCDVYTMDGEFHENLHQDAVRISQQANVKYPQLIGDADFLRKSGPYFDALPTVFYLDGQGNILDMTSGLETSGYVLKVQALLEREGA